jgi:histidinol-phosphate aminotransferase
MFRQAFSLKKLIRPNVKAMRPYSSARSEFSGKAAIFLDANENPNERADRGPCREINRYPDPAQWKLREAFASMREVSSENLFLGNGSDEAIDLLMRVFARPGKDGVLVCEPSYRMYEVLAGLNDLFVARFSLDKDFDLCAESLLGSLAKRCRLIFICSPNNPTGNAIKRREILKVVRAFSGIVVVDEAYIDYSGRRSIVKLVQKFPNLVVLQTFSKALGLAGARVGAAFADRAIIAELSRVKCPYNVSRPAQCLALEALGDSARLKREVRRVVSERGRISSELRRLEFVERVFPSAANFILVKVKAPQSVYDYLLSRGIVVRNVTSYRGCESCLRLTIGSGRENTRLLSALRRYR